MRQITFLLLSALLLLSACSKNIKNKEAVQKGLINHLTKNTSLTVSSMDIEVTSVEFKDKQANATVTFKPKGGPADAGMTMRYTLDQKGDEWVVQAKKDSGMGGGAGHGAVGEAPAATAPPASPEGGMPPNHPPVGGAKK